MRTAAIGLGGNLGDRAATLTEALARLCDGTGTRLLARSSLWETAPWGDPNQGPFLNAAALVATDLAPEALLARCLAVEAGLGRDRAASRRWGPRPIDLDILYVEGIERDGPDLSLPHPRLLERAFVLVPLAEIAPDAVVAGRRVADAAAAVGAEGVTRWGDWPTG